MLQHHLNSYAETSAASLEQTTSSSSRLGAILPLRPRCSRASLWPCFTTCTLQRTYATTLKFLCSLFGRGAAGVHEANFPWTMAGLRTAATAEDCGRRCLNGTFVLERLRARDQQSSPTTALANLYALGMPVIGNHLGRAYRLEGTIYSACSVHRICDTTHKVPRMSTP
jgi:hypothetical protein